ncbi:MAG: metallopeptidase TldD-related protein, partial [Methanosarcinales archaeon]
IRIIYDSATFINGQKSELKYCQSNLNKENMQEGKYTQTNVDDLLPYNVREVAVARDLIEHTFHFDRKGISLPTEEEVYDTLIPSRINMYDAELREFSREHKNSGLTRILNVEQKIIVNSKGGKVIQTIPFFGISYSQGYNPIPTYRSIKAVCTSEEDMKRLPNLIKFLADPTLDKRIKKAKSFGEAFHELYKISGLKYGSLEEAGIPLAELYDVVMLTGVPIHEIFGHQFEEPVRLLNFGESGTFKYSQKIQNKDIVLMDNPQQEIDGFKPEGFTFVDAYGRKREPRIHIKDGKVIGFLGSEYVDSEKLKKYLGLEKSKFVGNASQYYDGHFPQPRMSCTVIDGPTEKIDLEGKILLVPHEGSTDPVRKDYTVRVFEAYVIKNGKPKRMIPLQVSGGINQALANITLLDDLNYGTGICRKLEPMYYPQSREAQIPVSQFVKSQLWHGQQVYPLPISDFHLRILEKRL